MPEYRFFLDQPFEINLTTYLENEEFRHLKVMRRKSGDTIELVNGKNQLAKATLICIHKKDAELTLSEVIESKPTRQIILAQALLRPKNLDLVIEKGTELGATSFWLFPADQSEKKSLSSNQLNRLRQITISALKQCGRLDLPIIAQKPSLSLWKESFPGKAYFGDPASKIPISSYSGSVILFIGPEKGFSSQEKSFLCNSLKAKGIYLNPNILRAETAALCGLSKIS